MFELLRKIADRHRKATSHAPSGAAKDEDIKQTKYILSRIFVSKHVTLLQCLGIVNIEGQLASLSNP